MQAASANVPPRRQTSAPLVVTRTTPPPREDDSTMQQQHTLECDYDKSPTNIYRAIEARNWKQVIKMLEDEDDDSRTQQCATWVVRKEPNGQLRWRLLPLHAALIFRAPHEVIEALLEVFPAGAKFKDDQGMLPLHLCLRNKTPDFAIIEELLTAHPGAIYVNDRKGRTPLQGGLAAMKDSDVESKSILTVLQLVSQISAAGEKQKFLQEQSQSKQQRLKLEQEQQSQRWNQLHKDFEREYANLLIEKDELKKEYQAKLQASLQNETDSKLQLMEAHRRLESLQSPASRRRELCLQEENQNLRRLLQNMVDTHSSLAVQLEEWNVEQEQRTELLRQCIELDQSSTSRLEFIDQWKHDLEEIRSSAVGQLDSLLTKEASQSTEDDGEDQYGVEGVTENEEREALVEVEDEENEKEAEITEHNQCRESSSCDSASINVEQEEKKDGSPSPPA